MDRDQKTSHSLPVAWDPLPARWRADALEAGYPTSACGHCGELFQTAGGVNTLGLLLSTRDQHVKDNHAGTATALEAEGL